MTNEEIIAQAKQLYGLDITDDDIENNVVTTTAIVPISFYEGKKNSAQPPISYDNNKISATSDCSTCNVENQDVKDTNTTDSEIASTFTGINLGSDYDSIPSIHEGDAEVIIADSDAASNTEFENNNNAHHIDNDQDNQQVFNSVLDEESEFVPMSSEEFENLTSGNPTEFKSSNKEIDSLKLRLKQLSPYQLASIGVIYFVEDKDNEIVCPFCGNGSGRHRTGVKIEIWDNDCWRYSCGKCLKFYDNINFFAEYFKLDKKSDFFEILKRADDMTRDISVVTPPTVQYKPREKVSDAKLTAMIQSDILILKASDIPLEHMRGITFDTFQHFHCGYCAQWVHPKFKLDTTVKKYASPRIIIPTSPTSYVAVIPLAFRKSYEKIYWKMDAGSKHIFNIEDFAVGKQSIISEGEIDALSHFQVLGSEYACLAIGGAGNYEQFVYEISQKVTNKEDRLKCSIIIMFDDDNTGHENAPKCKDALIQAGFPAVIKFLTYGDANQILMDKGDSVLLAQDEEILQDAQIELDTVRKNISLSQDKPPSDETANIDNEVNVITQEELTTIKNQIENCVEDARVILQSLDSQDFTAEILYDEYITNAAAIIAVFDMKSYLTFKESLKKNKIGLRDFEKLINPTKESFEKIFDYVKTLENQRQVADTAEKYKNEDTQTEEVKEVEENRTTRACISNCPIDLDLPTYFTMDYTGIWREIDGKKELISLTPTIIIEKFIDVDTGDSSFHLGFYRRQGGGRWCDGKYYSASTLASGIKILSIADAGINISQKYGKYFAEYLTNLKDSYDNPNRIPVKKLYNRTGWADDSYKKFIYPNRNLGDSVLNDSENFYRDKFTSKGDFNQWKERIVGLIRSGLPVINTILGLALAAPLLKICGVRNQQLLLWCTTGKGKSAAAKLAMSVYGNPEELKNTFNGTPNFIDGLSPKFNDLPIWVDEFQSANKKIRESVDTMIYKYESGKTRGRCRQDGEQPPTINFHGVRFFTAEQPIQTMSANAGTYNRLLSLSTENIFPADYDVAELHKFLENNYGHLGGQWIDFISDNVESIKRKYSDNLKIFNEGAKKYGWLENWDKAMAVTLTALQFGMELISDGKINHAEMKKIFFDNFDAILEEIPTKNSVMNWQRAQQAIIDYTQSHEKFFKIEQASRIKSSDNPDKWVQVNVVKYDSNVGSAYTVYGIKFLNGTVGFFPSELNRILVDELKFPSSTSIIREFAQNGLLDYNKNLSKKSKTDKNRLYQKTVNYYVDAIDTSTNESHCPYSTVKRSSNRLYLFKASAFSPMIDSDAD